MSRTINPVMQHHNPEDPSPCKTNCNSTLQTFSTNDWPPLNSPPFIKYSSPLFKFELVRESQDSLGDRSEDTISDTKSLRDE